MGEFVKDHALPSAILVWIIHMRTEDDRGLLYCPKRSSTVGPASAPLWLRLVRTYHGYGFARSPTEVIKASRPSTSRLDIKVARSTEEIPADLIEMLGQMRPATL